MARKLHGDALEMRLKNCLPIDYVDPGTGIHRYREVSTMSTQTAAAGNPSTLADIWPEPGASRIPARVYTSPEVYARELERIFYGRHWSYVGLAAEVPEPGSFKRIAATAAQEAA